MTNAIEARGLRKTFVRRRSVRELVRSPFARAERVHALRGVDLDVREGEIFGLLGPNGAGKTTLLKILACLVLPDDGGAHVRGLSIDDEYAVKRRIGLVHSDERSFYWRLSARENLRFFSVLYDVPRARIESRIDELLARVHMLEAADRPFSDYSSGMKQRIAIARALLHDPPVLLMDEPTRSLDPASSLELRRFLLEELHGRMGKTILLATHNLREAEVLSDRIAVLARGLVHSVGTVDEVRRGVSGAPRYALELDEGVAPPPGLPLQVLSEETADGVRRFEVQLEPGATLDDVLRALVEARVAIRACDRIEPDLEDVFARLLAEERGT